MTFKVIVDDKVLNLIKTKFKSDKKVIQKAINKLSDNPRQGDYVFGIDEFDVRELKIKGLRLFTAQYKNIVFVEVLEDFRKVVRVVDIARKNKNKQQQQTIDDIKKRLKTFGLS